MAIDFSVPGASRSAGGHSLGFRAEFFFQDWQHRPVELLRLGDAHLMDFESNDRESGARKHFDHPAWPQIWKSEIVGLDQDERFFDLRVGGKADGTIQDAAVGIGKLGPEFQIALDCFWIESCEHAGLKIRYVT